VFAVAIHEGMDLTNYECTGCATYTLEPGTPRCFTMQMLAPDKNHYDVLIGVGRYTFVC